MQLIRERTKVENRVTLSLSFRKTKTVHGNHDMT
jgi:hypothetical protein